MLRHLGQVLELEPCRVGFGCRCVAHQPGAGQPAFLAGVADAAVDRDREGAEDVAQGTDQRHVEHIAIALSGELRQAVYQF